MKPNYVAEKSAWSVVSFLWILSCILVIPAVILVFRIIAVKKFRLEFYDDKIVIKSGWLNTKKKQMAFMGVTSVEVEKSLWGNLFGYGNVIVDCVGKWDINFTSYIKKPEKLEQYLQTRIVTAQGVTNSAGNIFVHM